jgi:hypothetical protein
MSSEQRTARETLIDKVRRDIGTVRSVAQRRSNPDRDHRMMIDRLIQWEDELLAALRAAPAPTGDYSKVEQDCRGCMGPCGRCHESDGAAPAPEGETIDVVDAYDVKIAEISQPASPAPTPEGRETELLREVDHWVERYNTLDTWRVQTLQRALKAEQAIREAKAETLREVRAKLGQWLDQGHSFTCPVYDGAPCTCGLSAALSALTGGTEEP